MSITRSILLLALLSASACDSAPVVPPDAGMDAVVEPDAGCPAPAALGMPCCEALGADACGARMFCAAFDGETSPTCHRERSLAGGESCTDDVQCASDDCASGACAEPPCTKNVVLMGFWPPTNEMLREWSTNTEQNPDGWVGENWEGFGYDVYSFFPEFPPDGDPTNDAIGQAGSVGSPDFDLQVDYQETSADFWRIVDEHQPIVLLTTSRGSIGWEIEAIEGGHGVVGGMGSPETDWYSDGWETVTLPTEATIDPRSWTAISTYRQGNTLPTQLPVQAIVDATSALAIANVRVDATGTSGNYLSGFLGLHGVYFNSLNAYNAAAGHIHVGGDVTVENARTLVQTTLRAILEQHPISTTECP